MCAENYKGHNINIVTYNLSSLCAHLWMFVHVSECVLGVENHPKCQVDNRVNYKMFGVCDVMQRLDCSIRDLSLNSV